MAAPGLAHSPLALMLLDLARRHANGSVHLGGRRVVVRSGAVIDVAAAEGDESLPEFLVRAGRASAADVAEARKRAPDEVADELVRMGRLTQTTLRSSRRALWLDRLVRSLDTDSEPRFEPEPPDGRDEAGVGMVPLVLDALERRAAAGDAEVVGALADHLFEWLPPGPHSDVARKWSKLDADGAEPVADLLSRSPAGPSRIAALVRAGFARLSPPGAAPAPPPRRASIAHPGPGSQRPPATSLPPPREPRLKLDPGQAPRPEPPADLAVPLWRPPAPTASLADPLDPLEREIAALEEAEAPGIERARVWRALARTWQREYGALEEAARAWREAVHADPSDGTALDEAALLCAAMGRTDLARSYAQAEVGVAASASERARALRRVAEMAVREGDTAAAARALEEAAEADPERADSALWLVRLHRAMGDSPGAVRWARRAATRCRERRPDRARALLAWAATVRPDDVELLEEYAAALTRDGYDEAAVSLLGEAARATPHADERRRLLLDAAERSEAAGRPDLAGERLLEAFDAEPHADVLHEPLAADLGAAGDGALTAVVLEEIAEVALPEQRAQWLLRAAEAHAALPGGGEWAEELIARALVLDPGCREAIDALRARAEELRDPTVLADALERAARRAMFEGHPEAASLLRVLAPIAEKDLASPPRALWAWECVAGLDASDQEATHHAARLRPETELAQETVAAAERALEAADAEARPAAARKLATALRDQPDDAARAIALYREALEADPDDAVAAFSVERLLRLRGNAAGLCELLRRRAEREPSPGDRARHLSLLAAFEWGQGHFRACADACLRLLDVEGEHPVAAARLDRAGRRLDEPELRQRAVEARVNAAAAPRGRARALVALAHQLEGAGAVEEAIAAARRAIASEGRAADASALLLRHLEWLAPPDALGVVEHARAAMGDSPPLLELATQVAERARRPEQALEYLEAWASLMPGDPRVTRWRLGMALGEEDPRRIAALAEEALSPDALDEQTSATIRRALARLGQLGATAEAARLALVAADRVGHRDPEILSLAERLADASDRPPHRVAALERLVAHAEGNGRIGPLRKLAALHRAQGHRAAEARTLLRLLADAPYDAEALDRLAQIYAETGEAERLSAVLAVRLEGAVTFEDRRQAFLDLAAATAWAAGDVDRAEGFLLGLVREASDEERERAVVTATGALVALDEPVRAVEMLLSEAERAAAPQAGRMCERAVAIAERAAEDPSLALRTAARGLQIAPGSTGLLVAFERLALEVGDVAAARRTYEALADRSMGPHGRRALHYRQARWLERAGDLPAALQAYDRAFALQPGGGIVFQSIDRIATELGEHEPLVRACLTLAERTPSVEHRVALVRKAAELLDRNLGDWRRAFEVLFGCWQRTGRPVLLDPLRGLARKAAGADPHGAARLREQLVAQLREWAEQTWDADAKVELLRSAARVHAEDGDDVAAAAAVVDQIAALAEAEDAAVDKVAEVLCDLAGWYAARNAAEVARGHLQHALELAPGHARARSMAEELDARLDDGVETRPASVVARSEGTPFESAETGPAPEPPPVEPSPAPRHATSSVPPGPPADAPIEELEGHAFALAADESHQRTALQLLLDVLRRDPSRVAALRVLLEVTRRVGVPALGNVVASILGMFDDGVEPPDEEPLAGLGRHIDDLPQVLAGGTPTAAARALAVVWHAAPHLFRRRLEDYGLLGTDRIGDTGPRPLSRAYALALEVLSPGDVSLFAHHGDEPLVHVVPTQPPSVAVPLEAEDEPASLRFRVGRGLEMARPENLLVAVLDPEGRGILLESIAAAFGPTDAAATVSRQAAELASELWNTVPARAQAELRELLGGTAVILDADAAFASMQAAAVRAGLAVAGGVVASVAGLLWDEPTLAEARPDTEAGYVAACQASAPLRELIRFALSDPYLAARATAAANTP
ncbi:MAG: hypothetical protein ACODAU_02375 [Myxococcota bacterium]